MAVYPLGSKKNPYLDETKPHAKLIGVKDERKNYYHLSVGDPFWFKNVYTGKYTKGVVISIDFDKDEIEFYINKKAYAEVQRVNRMRDSK